MKIYPHFFLRITCILAVLWMAGCGSQPEKGTTIEEKPDKIQLTWFFSAGKATLDLAPAIVKAFNDSQDEVELKLDAVHPSLEPDRLTKMIATGEMPDILGPMDGTEYLGLFQANRLFDDLEPALVDELKTISPALLDMWRVEGKLVGIPVGIRPSVLIYNKSLFDKAGVAYPPHSYAEVYADGSEWNILKLEEIALQLTNDINGNNALAPAFDTELIAKYGFTWHWMNGRGLVNIFGADPVVDNQGSAALPALWRDGYNWYHSGIWEKHFIPTGNYNSREPFVSGNIAMMINNMWYLRNLKNAPFQWDLAAIPAYQGQSNVDWLSGAMLVSRSTANSDQAIRAAYRLANTIELLKIMGYIPASDALLPEVLSALKNEFPGVDFQAALDGLNHLSQPASTSPLPAGMDVKFEDFRDRISTVEGLDLDTELDKLDAEIRTVPVK
jgi:multiple sugar transport system substrate-binding protein